MSKEESFVKLEALLESYSGFLSPPELLSPSVMVLCDGPAFASFSLPVPAYVREIQFTLSAAAYVSVSLSLDLDTPSLTAVPAGTHGPGQVHLRLAAARLVNSIRIDLRPHSHAVEAPVHKFTVHSGGEMFPSNDPRATTGPPRELTLRCSTALAHCAGPALPPHPHRPALRPLPPDLAAAAAAVAGPATTLKEFEPLAVGSVAFIGTPVGRAEAAAALRRVLRDAPAGTRAAPSAAPSKRQIEDTGTDMAFSSEPFAKIVIKHI